MYGTSKSQIKRIQSEHKIPLLDIDIQGCEKFLKAFPETNTLFIFPPSIDILKTRMIMKELSKEDIKIRLGNAS